MSRAPAPEPGATVLEIDGVDKRYGKLTALDGVSLSVSAGEFVALLGPNGAGKSTLFQILSGLFVPDGGTVRINGRDISRDAVPALSSLGIVFQQPTLDLDLTVRGNLRFHARLHGLSRKITSERIDLELERLGLTDRLNDTARTLSGGNRRRVELARALLHRPTILLMDEPTVGLDPASRRDLSVHVRRLCSEQGLGVLWATHLVDEVEQADRVVLLDQGRVLQDGTPSELAQAAGARSLAEAFLTLTGAGEAA